MAQYNFDMGKGALALICLILWGLYPRSASGQEAPQPGQPVDLPIGATVENDPRQMDDLHRMRSIYQSVAERCVDLSNWNYLVVAVELSSTKAPPKKVRIYQDVSEELAECITDHLKSSTFPAMPYHLGQAYAGAVDFEATGRLRASWVWRLRWRGLAYGFVNPNGDRGLVGLRGLVPITRGPYLQPVIHIDGEVGRVSGQQEYEVAARAGLGFARERFRCTLSVGAGISKLGDTVPTALVVPVEAWLSYRRNGGGLEAWARNTNSPSNERYGGAEHAALGSVALSLGLGVWAPALWRGGIALGIRYDERLDEKRLGVWMGTEIRAGMF